MTHRLPATSPITLTTSAESSLGRRLSMTAIGASSRLATRRARCVPPVSGEMMITSWPWRSRTRRARIFVVVSASTGMSKKPWMASAWRSTQITRLAPASSMMLAISLALIGSRGWVFFSLRW